MSSRLPGSARILIFEANSHSNITQSIIVSETAMTLSKHTDFPGDVTYFGMFVSVPRNFITVLFPRLFPNKLAHFP